MDDRYRSYQRLQVAGASAGVLELTLGTGDAINAVDARMHAELADIWGDLERDPQTSVVLIKGAGGGFLSGGSPALAEEMATDGEARFRMLDEHRRFIRGMLDCPKPVVSCVTGRAVGEGLIIALLSDIAVVTPSTVLLDRHTPLGVVAGDHAALVWPLLCGLNRAKYHLLLGEPLTGEEAAAAGLVARCVDEGEVEGVARDLAERLAAGSGTAIAWTKYALNNWLRMAGPILDASLGFEFLGFSHPDFREGINAAREGREPDFDSGSTGPDGGS